MAAASTDAFAQWAPQAARLRAGADSLVCYPIKRGESATQVARRITGDGRNTYRTSFQIMNASSRFVPKSQYDRIRAGWRACVIKPAVVRAESADVVRGTKAPDAAEASKAESADVIAASNNVVPTGDALKPVVDSPLAPPDDGPSVWLTNFMVLWLGAAIVVPWVGWRALDSYLARRKTTAIVIQHFAERFLSEFERPLIRFHASEHPVRSRIRHHARSGRFDILIAPGQGRRYPNLTDHKNNVEYDVTRVLQTLDDGSFASGPLYTQAGWVVVPFQFSIRPERSRRRKGRSEANR